MQFIDTSVQDFFVVLFYLIEEELITTNTVGYNGSWMGETVQLTQKTALDNYDLDDWESTQTYGTITTKCRILLVRIRSI